MFNTGMKELDDIKLLEYDLLGKCDDMMVVLN